VDIESSKNLIHSFREVKSKWQSYNSWFGAPGAPRAPGAPGAPGAPWAPVLLPDVF